jgi:hypothetical protein
MSAVVVRRTGVVFLGLLALGLFVVITRVMAVAPTVLEACVNPGNGMMRLVDASTACHAKETRVSWNSEGPAGPPGPPGPPGEDGEDGEDGGGGPPFEWVCTPANIDLGGNNTGEIDIFNGSSDTTANVAAHFLSADGTNLAGLNVPGTNPPENYPGQTGTNTVAVNPRNTLIIKYTIGTGVRTTLSSSLLTSIFVTSDQLIGVGYQLTGLPNTTPCSQVR